MRLLAALLALSALAAGCVTAPPDSTPASVRPQEDAAAMQALRALMADVPCEADVGPETSANMLQLGKLQLDEGDVGEIDIRGDVALVSRHQLGGLYTVDVSDPRDPVVLGTLAIDETSALDVKWLPDGRGAVIGSGGKLFVVDLADLTTPVVVAEADVPTQAHMVTLAELNGKTYAFVASQTNDQPAFVYEMDGWNFTMVGSFGTVPGTPLASGPLGNHDITIVDDTLLGDAPTLYLADGVMGWSAWSLEDPANPTRLGGSIGQELGVGYVHTIRVGFHEGKRIVVTMQEVGQNSLKVYDATDLTMPVLLARWNADATRPTIPQHNIQLLGDWLFMAHYTEGVYAFNLSAVIAGPPVLGTLSLAPAAHFAVESPADGGPLGFANVWDVSVSKGILYVSDLTASVTTVGFGCLVPGDEWATATQ